MSEIFDALHQSQGQQVGVGARRFSSAKELLRAVEQENATATGLPGSEGQVIPLEQPGQFPTACISLPEGSRLICLARDESLAAEKFRFVATRLRHMQQKRSLKRIVITSSVPGEGKTMVAANLASALAGGKQQVLLLEGDLRRPSLGQQLGVLGVPGLSECLQSKTDRSNDIYRVQDSNLHLLLAGKTPASALDLMEPTRLSLLLNNLSTIFDWVIIDCPPLLPLADTSVWMRLSDAVLLVTRPGVTTKRLLERTMETIERSKFLGVLLNASSEASGDHYYRYYAGPRPGTTLPAVAT